MADEKIYMVSVTVSMLEDEDETRLSSGMLGLFKYLKNADAFARAIQADAPQTYIDLDEGVIKTVSGTTYLAERGDTDG